MKTKKILRMTLSIFIFSFLNVVGAVSVNAVDFKDVSKEHINYKAIMDLKSRGIVGGYPDGTFRPDQAVNRVEALKIILLGAAIDTTSSTRTAGFSDISQQQWYAPYLNKAVELKLVQGYGDGTFKPTQTVNLVENLKMLLLAKKVLLDKVIVTEDPYADAFKDQWYAVYLQYAKDKLLIVADSKNKIYPSQGMTRAKLAETIYRVIYVQEENLDWFPPTEVNDPTQPAENYLEINIQNTTFSLPEMTIPIGSTVRWTNKDLTEHTVTSDSGSILSSKLLKKGQTYVHTFDSEGVFEYHCASHSFMKGKIIVKPVDQVPTI